MPILRDAASRLLKMRGALVDARFVDLALAHLLGEGRIKSHRASELLCQRQHRVDVRCVEFDEASELLHRGEHRIELEWATAFQILQHRGAMRADARRAVDAPLDVDAEMHADAAADAFGLKHHVARQRACAGIGRDHTVFAKRDDFALATPSLEDVYLALGGDAANATKGLVKA